MKSLIWKQCQESKIHFCIFGVWMLLAVLYIIAYELGHHYRAVVGGFSSMAMFYAIVAAIVLAARVSQGERSNGTLAYTISLPISIRRVASVRIIGALLILSLPIVFASGVLAAALAVGLVEQAESRLVVNDFVSMDQRQVGALSSSLEQLLSVTAIAMLGGVELLVVLCWCGCWLRNQAHVGLLGAVIALGLMITSGLLWYGQTRSAVGQLLYGAVHPQSLVIHWGYGGATGSYCDHELAQYRWFAMGLAIPLLATIARCFVLQYGRAPSIQILHSIRSSRFAIPSILSFITMPLLTRRMALIWLEVRQALPLAFYGLLFAILVTVSNQFPESGFGGDFATNLRSNLPHSVFFVGMLWAVVMGSAVYSSDLYSDLGSFRRTRPISHSMWFWNKFFIGLVAVLLLLDSVTILVSWSAPRTQMTNGMSYAYIACFPIVHTLMYSLAVLGTCLTRKPLFGGVLAILSFAIATMVITSFPATMQLEPVHIYNNLLSDERGGQIDLTKHAYPIVYGLLVASAIACSIVSSHFAKPFQLTFPRNSRISG